MIALWRISRHTDLAGLGGERADGRWHRAAPGKRIVYLAEHPALSLIETLVHLKGNPALFPSRYSLARIEVEEAVFAAARRLVEEAGTNLGLPESRTQQIGDAWLREGATALARVPSFPSPFSTNYLLNPKHPDASRFRVASAHEIEYDPRLLQMRATERGSA